LRNETTLQVTEEFHQDAPELSAAQVDARLRWARQRGHPFYLWPEVPRAHWLAALEEIGRVTGALLRGDRGVRLESPAAVPPAVWSRALGVAAFTSGMGPLLGWWHQLGMLAADEPAGAVLREHLVHARARAVRMSDALEHALATLARAGIDVTLLKGAYTARHCFAEPGLRPMGDLDLMVPRGAVAAAEATLGFGGYALVAGSRVARPYRSDWQPPGAPRTIRSLLVHHAENPYTIDLHDSLEFDFFGVRRVRFDAAPFRVPTDGGAHALAQPLLLAHLATHASQGLHNLTLLRLTELVLLLQHDVVAWDELSVLLEEAGAARFVYPAFQLVERFVPGSVEPTFLERLGRGATASMRAVVARVTPATAQRLGDVTLDERFMWCATSFDRVRRVAHMFAPAGSGSLRRLRRIYTERVYRIVRGRVTVRES
jgi:hypothetical protein